MRSQVEKAIGKIGQRSKYYTAANGEQRAHLEAGIYRKQIEAAYFDATRAKMNPDDCIREAIRAGALSLVSNRSVELRGLDHEELARRVWERIGKSIATLHDLKSFETRKNHVIAVVTNYLTSLAQEFLERTGAEVNAAV
jgi:hypothetical protein